MDWVQRAVKARDPRTDGLASTGGGAPPSHGGAPAGAGGRLAALRSKMRNLRTRPSLLNKSA